MSFIMTVAMIYVIHKIIQFLKYCYYYTLYKRKQDNIILELIVYIDEIEIETINEDCEINENKEE